MFRTGSTKRFPACGHPSLFVIFLLVLAFICIAAWNCWTTCKSEKKGATLAQSDMAHVWRVVKLRKRRQLCWLHCSLETALTYLHQKKPIRDDFYGCRSCGLAPRRRLHTGHPPARCPATLKSPATARRRRRCGGRQGSRECLAQLARKSQSRLGFPSYHVSAGTNSKTKRVHEC